MNDHGARIVLITGCSSGIGACLADAIHRRQGYRVFATARRRQDVEHSEYLTIDEVATIMKVGKNTVERLIATGMSNREIAEELTIAEKTVKTHVSNILSKLHLADRTQAAIYALQKGLGPEQ